MDKQTNNKPNYRKDVISIVLIACLLLVCFIIKNAYDKYQDHKEETIRQELLKREKELAKAREDLKKALKDVKTTKDKVVTIKKEEEPKVVKQEVKPVQPKPEVKKPVAKKEKLVIPTLKKEKGLDPYKVKRYASVFNKLSEEQKLIFAASYFNGAKKNLGLTQAAIIWKESHFGKVLVNKTDGLYGSYGLGQILLSTAMSRNGIKDTSKNRDAMILKLTSDNAFNLKEGLEELVGWRKIHRDIKKRKDWLMWTIGSYNNGHKSISNEKGLKYAKDVEYRIEALKYYFLTFKGSGNKRIDKYFFDIKYRIHPWTKPKAKNTKKEVSK